MNEEITEEDEDFDDDVLLDKTPDVIVALLGFDPLELMDGDDAEEVAKD